MNHSTLIEQQVLEAQSLPQLPGDYQPQTVEIFDQMGVLTGLVNGEFVIDSPREESHNPLYLAVYFDGSLVFFSKKETILLNRLSSVAQFQNLIAQI